MSIYWIIESLLIHYKYIALNSLIFIYLSNPFNAYEEHFTLP